MAASSVTRETGRIFGWRRPIKASWLIGAKRNVIVWLNFEVVGLEHRFEPPAPLSQGKKLGELPIDALRARLTELKERVGELSDWIDWRHLSGRFAHLGLG